MDCRVSLESSESGVESQGGGQTSVMTFLFCQQASTWTATKFTFEVMKPPSEVHSSVHRSFDACLQLAFAEAVSLHRIIH